MLQNKNFHAQPSIYDVYNKSVVSVPNNLWNNPAVLHFTLSYDIEIPGVGDYNLLIIHLDSTVDIYYGYSGDFDFR